MRNVATRIVLQVLGIGVLVAGGLAIAIAALVAAILIGPDRKAARERG